MRTIVDRYAAASGSGSLVVRTRPRLSACTVCRRRIRPGHEVCLPCEARAAREAAQAEEAGEDADGEDRPTPAPPEMNLVAILLATALCVAATWWTLRDERTATPDRSEQTCVVTEESPVAPDC